MNRSKPLRMSIVGTGKVAQALGRAWQKGGVEIVEVWGRSQGRAQELGRKLNAVVVNDIATLSTDIDAVAVLVSDDAIREVAHSLPHNVKRFHASGVTDKDVLGGENGVVWPIKSFSTDTHEEDLTEVPFAVEAGSKEFQAMLHRLVRESGGKPFEASSQIRAKIHLAAVFTHNFSNHCLALSQQILDEEGLPKDLMRPLAEGLMEGAKKGNSFSLQTGVALRKDLGSQMKHLELLKEFSNNKALTEFYKFVSKHIADSHEL
ncbi:MAG: DUF2520 domain-containing protein [Flavobacteriales bacterium]|nr:DUF2520 domain-containing protein [Flavobacteriales bacterium]